MRHLCANSKQVHAWLPVSINKFTNLELGVEHVITPVRRSLRFHGTLLLFISQVFLDDSDYVTKSATKPSLSLSNDENVPANRMNTTTTDDASKSSKVRELLQDHDFAFVPNEVSVASPSKLTLHPRTFTLKCPIWWSRLVGVYVIKWETD